MSARDDYPIINDVTVGRFGAFASEQATAILDEVDRLRLDCAYMEDIARCRGEENERLRHVVRAANEWLRGSFGHEQIADEDTGEPLCGDDGLPWPCPYERLNAALLELDATTASSPSLLTHPLGGGGDYSDSSPPEQSP
jgi:hypothetical protein